MQTLRSQKLAEAKILVRVPNWIGDAVLCLPALRELRRALPRAELVLLTRPWAREVFPIKELRCRTIPYDTRGTHRGIAGRMEMARLLRRESFAAAILFQNAFDAALIAMLAGIPIRAGYARHGRRLLLTHPVPVPRRGEIPAHEAHGYLELLRRLGLIGEYGEVNEIALAGAGKEEARRQLEEVLKAGRQGRGVRSQESGEKQVPRRFAPRDDSRGSRAGTEALLVGISPGATFGTAKRWPAERFGLLAGKLSEELGAVCVLFGSEQERPLAEKVAAQAGEGAVSLAGKTSLPEFRQLVEGCDLYVTNDTGTMHLAAALGVPTLAIFGPTDEHGTRPLGARVQLVVGRAFCRPCLLRHCPIDHRCMNSIAVEEVFEKARGMLMRTERKTCNHKDTKAQRSEVGN